jgi:hypothetical protein
MSCVVEWIRGHLAEGRTVATISVAEAYHAGIVASGLCPGATIHPPPPAWDGHILVVDEDGAEWAAVLAEWAP